MQKASPAPYSPAPLTDEGDGTARCALLPLQKASYHFGWLVGCRFYRGMSITSLSTQVFLGALLGPILLISTPASCSDEHRLILNKTVRSSARVYTGELQMDLTDTLEACQV